MPPTRDSEDGGGGIGGATCSRHNQLRNRHVPTRPAPEPLRLRPCQADQQLHPPGLGGTVLPVCSYSGAFCYRKVRPVPFATHIVSWDADRRTILRPSASR